MHLVHVPNCNIVWLPCLTPNLLLFVYTVNFYTNKIVVLFFCGLVKVVGSVNNECALNLT